MTRHRQPDDQQQRDGSDGMAGTAREQRALRDHDAKKREWQSALKAAQRELESAQRRLQRVAAMLADQANCSPSRRNTGQRRCAPSRRVINVSQTTKPTKAKSKKKAKKAKKTDKEKKKDDKKKLINE